MKKKRTSYFLSLCCSSCLIFNSALWAAMPVSDEESLESDTVITIIAKPQPSQALTSPQSVTVIDGRKLEQVRGQTAIDAIKDAPGVAAFTTGAGISKPVVRGLTSQRVLLVSDGVRQEFQQWGDEHAPQIDPFNVERVEVLRGPNSLLYGSDALGGVVAFSRPPLPDASKGASKLDGKVDANYFSNNQQSAGGLSLFGASGPFGYRFSVSGRDGDNYETPKAEVPNSAIKDFNGHGALGIRKDWGEFQVNYGHVDQKVELPEEDPIATPRQELVDDQVSLHAAVPVGGGKIEAIGAYQKNEREEFEEENAPEAILNFITKTTSLDLKAHHAPIGPLKGTVGFSANNQDLKSDKEEQLIPSYDSRVLGGYLYEELSVDEFTFSAGVRGDTQKLDIEENAVLSVAAQTKKYNQVTGAAGAVWHAAEPLAFAVNVGRGFRSPTPFELFSNGEHEGTGRFEVGDPDLKPERSLNVDVATRYSTKRIKGEFAVFRNKISRFIFIQPTGGTFVDPDTGDTLPIFAYTQADATLTGGELSVEAMVTDWLVLNAGYDVVRGKNDQTDNDLPLIPADRFRGGVKLQCRRLGSIFERPYIAAGAKVYKEQDRVDPNETVTPGYTLWDMSAGTEIKVADSHLNLDIGVENLGDKEYFDHLSRNKTVGILSPGRNIYVKASLPFGVVK